ncbi:hypothetical protein [uncultured Draconibacterium sp.]|uniref:hypothetical protein n=1 Tax=uncultured Draconibacterium sp. TaxID=1573823 RepID=UPI0025D983A6|nr:hypothetical protein [uncultured Draconibacterium sp.]
MKVKRMSNLDPAEVDYVRSRLRDFKDEFIENSVSDDSPADSPEETMFHIKTFYLADSLISSLYRHLTGEQNYDYEE